MKKYVIRTNSGTEPQQLEQALERWSGSQFYAEAVVLGIDVGLEGIGVCVRRGAEILHAATWMIPWPESLEGRRQKRAWRHCRKNLKVRMGRLKMLFAKYDLPWFEDRDPALLHTDPFELRHRAITSQLSSKEALSLAVRHVVAHRGHNYNYFNDEGEYPWGNTFDFSKVCAALDGQILAAEEADKFSEDCVAFGWEPDKVEKFRALVAAKRTSGHEICEHLERYSREKRRNLRISPKGIAYPRAMVWRHLEEIVKNNSHLIDDCEGFLRELAVHPRESKDRSIFHYHRKTPDEMREHFSTKTKRCRHAAWLGLGDKISCAARECPEVRRFLLLEFLATRRIEVVGPPERRVGLPAGTIKALVEWQDLAESADLRERPKWKEGKTVFQASLKEHSLWPLAKQSPFNKAFLEVLQDLLCPSIANRKKVSTLSRDAAARLFEIATVGGFEPEGIVGRLSEYFKQRREAALDPAGRYPQVDFLLGAVARKDRVSTNRHPNRKRKGEVVSMGRLQELFSKLAHQLEGKPFPDYCVIEVIGDPPRTENQKLEIAKEISRRREESRRRFEQMEKEDRGSRSARLRLKLHEQQSGRSPFTGNPLGNDPLSPSLQVCHLFPASRGGLWVEDNLVLSTAEENARMGDRTPREAASELAGSWDKMRSHAAPMKWSRQKREIFEWQEETVPDFGNTTRMSQLARQLYVAVGKWMGLGEIADPTLRENRRSERIGTPSGYLTSIARAAWGMPKKDRDDLVHHMVDAITLAWIPPGAGMNSVRCGGVFFDQVDSVTGKTRLTLLPLGPDPEVVGKLAADDSPACPVVHFRPSSSKASMHDSTLLSVRADGQLASKVSIDKGKDKMDTVSLRQVLLDQGIAAKRVPSDARLAEWLDAPDGTPLRLNDGQSVKRKFAPAKEKSLFPVLGTVGKVGAGTNWQSVKIFNAGKFDGLELWRVFLPAKKSWKFFLRRVPSPRAMEALLRTAFSWFEANSVSLSTTLDANVFARLEKTHSSLKIHPVRWTRIRRGTEAMQTLRYLVEAGFPIRGGGPATWPEVELAIYGDSLPAEAVRIVDPKTGRPALIQKGQVFSLAVTPEGKPAQPGRASQNHWFKVTAILADGRVEFGPVRVTKWKKFALSREAICSLFGCLRSDDPPSDFAE